MKRFTSELSDASNIKSRQNRQNVQWALKSAITQLKMLKEIPPNGIAMFIGKTLSEEIVEIIEPPKPIKNTEYYCDKRFHTESIEKLYEKQELCGLIFVNGENCELYTVDISNCNRDKTGKASTRLKQHKKGGQSSARFGRLHDEKVVKYLKEIAEEARETFDAISMIIVAGISKRPAELLKYLHTDVAKKVIGVTVMTSATNFNEAVIPQMEALVTAYRSDLEWKMLQEFTEALQSGDKAIYGPAELSEALESGALAKLYISKNAADADFANLKLLHQGIEIIEIGVSLKGQELISMYGERFGIKWY